MTMRTKTAVVLTLVCATVAMVASIMLLWAPAHAAAETAASQLDPSVVKWGFIAAALATGLSALSAGYAVAIVGSAAIGALAEKPELLGRVLVMVGLAEGIAIYGLIVSILILNRLT